MCPTLFVHANGPTATHESGVKHVRAGRVDGDGITRSQRLLAGLERELVGDDAVEF